MRNLALELAALEIDPDTTSMQLSGLMTKGLGFTKAAKKERKKAYNNEKKHCILCNRDIRRAGWSDHLCTSRHKKAKRKDRAKKKKMKK